MKSPFAPFAKGGWGDFDATTLFDSHARVQRFGRESGEIFFRCRPLTGNGKIRPLCVFSASAVTLLTGAGSGFYGHAVL
jgi:hypothetical protein